MSEFKRKTITGLKWSFVDSSAGQGLTLLFGLVLARMLSPREFGMIGMLSIFLAVSQSLTDSGFTSALIRKKNCTSHDYSTVFYYNLLVSVFFCVLLFTSAGAISRFFNEPELQSLVQVLSFGLIVNATAIIQRTIFIKHVDFKSQTKISLISSFVSGIVAIYLAFMDYGVWSLVALSLIKGVVETALFWAFSAWRPLWVFNRNSFRELFGFGSKIMLSGLIDTAYRNIYYLIIGKYFSAAELGYFTMADELRAIPSQHLTSVVSRVSYPALAEIQDDASELKSNFRQLTKSTMFVSFALMFALASIAEALLVTLIGEQWVPAVGYLQLLCFVGMLYPIHSLNLKILMIKGRSDLFLRLEIIKKSLSIPTIIIGIIFGIKAMIVAMFINSCIAYYLNSYWSETLINYGLSKQLKDILPTFLFAIAGVVPANLFSVYTQFSPIVTLVSQILLLLISFILLGEMGFNNEYLYLKNHLIPKRGRPNE